MENKNNYPPDYNPLIAPSEQKESDELPEYVENEDDDAQFEDKQLENNN